jgi:hypothetical protein
LIGPFAISLIRFVLSFVNISVFEVMFSPAMFQAILKIPIIDLSIRPSIDSLPRKVIAFKLSFVDITAFHDKSSEAVFFA